MLTERVKKFAKRIYKKMHERKSERGRYRKLDKHYINHIDVYGDKYCESGTVVFFFRRPKRIALIDEILGKFVPKYMRRGTSIITLYDCTGRTFWHPGRLIIEKDRFFWIQSWGIDV